MQKFFLCSWNIHVTDGTISGKGDGSLLHTIQVKIGGCESINWIKAVSEVMAEVVAGLTHAKYQQEFMVSKINQLKSSHLVTGHFIWARFTGMSQLLCIVLGIVIGHNWPLGNDDVRKALRMFNVSPVSHGEGGFFPCQQTGNWGKTWPCILGKLGHASFRWIQWPTDLKWICQLRNRD